MARFYRLQLETVYLTHNGLTGGRPCKLRIAGLAGLRVAYGGQTAPSADGTPYTVAFARAKGQTLTVTVSALPSGVYESLVTLINQAIANNTTITAIGDGNEGDFNLELMPAMPEPIALSGEFSNDVLRNVGLNFIVYGVN